MFYHVTNPATGRIIAGVPQITQEEVASALCAADGGFLKWRHLNTTARSEILIKASSLIKANGALFARTIVIEQGKTFAQATSEVESSVATLTWMAKQGLRVFSENIPSKDSCLIQKLIFEPIGPIAAFTPWNYPLLMPIRKISSALSAGCSLILKPSECAPGASMLIADVFAKSGLPNGVLNIIFGDPMMIFDELVGSPIISKIDFTGSKSVGSMIQKRCAEHSMPLMTELGGGAIAIILEDADIVIAIEKLVFAKYRNAGQICHSPTRVFVQEQIFDEFLEKFVMKVRNLSVGSGLSEKIDMGPLVTSGRVKEMNKIVSKLKQCGAKIALGGKSIRQLGHYFEPTVVVSDYDTFNLTEELFGPIVILHKFKTIEEVIAAGNSALFDLAAYLFTKSIDNINQFVDEFKCGMLGINTFKISSPDLPFGGRRISGSGRVGGNLGIFEFLVPKLVVSDET